MPLDEAVVVASEIGAEYVWFDRLTDRPPLAELPQSELVQMAETVAEHDLKLFIISAAHPFKTVHLMDVDPDDPMTTDGYRREFDDLVRSMEIANLVGVDTVLSYGFAWPGEYSAAKPTWPMRWLTRGGVISDGDMDRLVAAFTPVLEEAERHDVNVALAQMPWNYSNTTGQLPAAGRAARLTAAEGHVGSRRQLQLWRVGRRRSRIQQHPPRTSTRFT